MSERKKVPSDDYSKLMNAIDSIVKCYSSLKLQSFDEVKVVQFHEIAKTIDRLKEAGAEIPNELRRLKIELSYHAKASEDSEKIIKKCLDELQEIEVRLVRTLTNVRHSISRLSGARQTKNKRYVKRSSPAILSKEIRKALRELGWSAKKSEVLQKVRFNMEGKFKPQDLERDVRGVLNWERWIVAEKDKMLKTGAMMAGAGFGIWALRRK